ncbi:hypothetical protein PG996_002555 [Apiospora saccharicola]|uniref:Uncharacterized protein n=1 Tax=Apiospora saccharicola TaxID=335842 RepID=A0ABR1WJU5_9PEZI
MPEFKPLPYLGSGPAPASAIFTGSGLRRNIRPRLFDSSDSGDAIVVPPEEGDAIPELKPLPYLGSGPAPASASASAVFASSRLRRATRAQSVGRSDSGVTTVLPQEDDDAMD